MTKVDDVCSHWHKERKKYPNSYFSYPLFFFKEMISHRKFVNRKLKSHHWWSYFNRLLNFYLFFFEREHKLGREKERGTEDRKPTLQWQADSTEPGCGAQTHELRDYDLSRSQMLKRLSHSGPWSFAFNDAPRIHGTSASIRHRQFMWGKGLRRQTWGSGP